MDGPGGDGPPERERALGDHSGSVNTRAEPDFTAVFAAHGGELAEGNSAWQDGAASRATMCLDSVDSEGVAGEGGDAIMLGTFDLAGMDQIWDTNLLPDAGPPVLSQALSAAAAAVAPVVARQPAPQVSMPRPKAPPSRPPAAARQRKAAQVKTEPSPNVGTAEDQGSGAAVCPICMNRAYRNGESPREGKGVTVGGESPSEGKRKAGRYRVREKPRKENMLALWNNKYGYRGPLYCKSCSESFRSHMLRCEHTPRSGCCRANPCEHCTKVLSYFEHPPATVFAMSDADKLKRKQSRAAKQAAKQALAAPPDGSDITAADEAHGGGAAQGGEQTKKSGALAAAAAAEKDKDRDDGKSSSGSGRLRPPTAKAARGRASSRAPRAAGRGGRGRAAAAPPAAAAVNVPLPPPPPPPTLPSVTATTYGGGDMRLEFAFKEDGSLSPGGLSVSSCSFSDSDEIESYYGTADSGGGAGSGRVETALRDFSRQYHTEEHQDALHEALLSPGTAPARDGSGGGTSQSLSSPEQPTPSKRQKTQPAAGGGGEVPTHRRQAPWQAVAGGGTTSTAMLAFQGTLMVLGVVLVIVGGLALGAAHGLLGGGGAGVEPAPSEQLHNFSTTTTAHVISGGG